MTGQVSNSLTFEGEHYVITKADPFPIFHPKMIGVTVSAYSTACRDGYVVNYEYKDSQLFARSMRLGVDHYAPLINGKDPEEIERTADGEYALMELIVGRHYKDIWLPLRYSGTVTIGRGWCGNLGRGNHGTAPAREFAEVKKLEFHVGEIQRISNVSGQYKAERAVFFRNEDRKRLRKQKSENRKRRWLDFKRRFMPFLVGNQEQNFQKAAGDDLKIPDFLLSDNKRSN